MVGTRLTVARRRRRCASTARVPPDKDPPPGVHAMGAVALAATAAYISSCTATEFVYDDIAAVKNNRDVCTHTPLSQIFVDDFWGTPIHKEQSHKSYRPLTILSYRLNFGIHDLDPFGYHVANVLLHVGVCMLYQILCHRIFRGLSESSTMASVVSKSASTISTVAALLFAVHPIHTEAVTSLVGRAELLSAMCYLGALLLYTKKSSNMEQSDKVNWFKVVVTVGLATLGMLCKEQSITVIGVCIIYEFINVSLNYRQSSASLWYRVCETLSRTWPLLSLTTLVLSLRFQIAGQSMPVFSRLEHPASVMATPWRQLTYNYFVGLNAFLMALPDTLCCDWSMGSVKGIESAIDLRLAAPLITYMTLFLLITRSLTSPVRQRLFSTVMMGTALCVVPFLPATNLFHRVGFVIAERVLYLPSMGFCCLVALGWSIISSRRYFSNAAHLLLVITVTAHFTKTVTRNLDWSSQHSLYTADLRVNPDNAKLHNNLGRVYEQRDSFEEALEHYRNAISKQPDDVRGYLNAGRVLVHLKRLEEAERTFQMARSLLPQETIAVNNSYSEGKSKLQADEALTVTSQHLKVFLHLATLIARNTSRAEEADDLLQQVIKLRADFAEAYVTRGQFLLQLNRTSEAVEMYRKAIVYDSNNPDYHYNLGVLFVDQGKNDDALRLFNRALTLQPNHEQALLSAAELLDDLDGNPSVPNSELDHRIQDIIENGKQNENVYFNLGMVALGNGDDRKARDFLRRAIEIRPNMRSALFNLALLVSDKEPMEAVNLLNTLLQYHPAHIQGLVLLGDLNVNHLRNLNAAEECYRRILNIDPKNVQGAHNLCVVFVERGELSRAERCFQEVSELAPEVEYIRRHLEVTQAMLRNRSRATMVTTSPPMAPIMRQHPLALEVIRAGSAIV